LLGIHLSRTRFLQAGADHRAAVLIGKRGLSGSEELGGNTRPSFRPSTVLARHARRSKWSLGPFWGQNDDILGHQLCGPPGTEAAET